MKEPVRLLVLEDNPTDIELLRRTLEGAGLPCHVTHVDSEATFRAAVNGAGQFDLIISDYSLPAFDGKRALALAREQRPETPFIFVSGTIGEEVAIESLVGGATDYVLKHKFGRLVPAVRRALKETSERTARRQAEHQLEVTLEQLKSLFDNLDEVFFSLDPRAGRLLQISPACERLYGLPQRAFFANPNFWRTFAASADLPVVDSAQSKLDAGESVSVEYRIAKPDGAFRWVMAKLKPVRDAEGRTIRIDGSISDISGNKELEAQFLRAQRMENLGTLAGGIAHDLNNVLAPIMMGVEVLRERNADSESQATLATLELCTKRGANLVKQILMFARGVEERRVTLHPGRLIQDLHSMLLRTFPKSIKIVVDIASDLWSVSADKTQIEQVLMNLCVNARDAMPSGGTLTITTRNRLANGENGSSEKEAFVVIEVADTGQGIPSENLERIFDPFFTTKAAGKGTGLGLSTVSAIVKSHGGSVAVASVMGRGTTFEVSLPALVADVQKEEDVKRNALPSGNGELVLVVDDDAAIRDLARTILDNYGYRVIVAVDGLDGVSVYSQHKESIAVVVTDLDMPIMDGPQMIQALERLNPAVRIVSTGGIIEGDKPGMKVAGCVRAVLEKPFSPAHLLKTLHNILQ
jgi:two-component system, cell cycle sensor histidine kinase and response regulator CckA